MATEAEAVLTNVECGGDIKEMIYCVCLGGAGCDDTPEIITAQKAHGKCGGSPPGTVTEILV